MVPEDLCANECQLFGGGIEEAAGTSGSSKYTSPGTGAVCNLAIYIATKHGYVACESGGE